MKELAALFLLICSTTSDEDLVNGIPDKISIQSYAESENLRIFPLTYSGSGKSFTTLEDALDDGLVVVKEKDEGEVNTVMIKNKGTSTVFVMAGEVVKGAKQDRMIENDLLIPPQSGWIEVAVYCTESGRWHGESKEFAKADINVSPSVRANARKDKSQSEVWSKVAENQQDVMGTNSETGAFRHIYESKEYQDDRDHYYKQLKNLPEKYPSMKGVIVCVGEEILCMDLFSSHTMIDNMWPKLLESYIVEAMRGGEKGSVSSSEAQRFLDAYSEVDLDDEYTPGKGDLYEIESRDAAGSALIYSGMLAHTDLFPD